MYQRTFVHEMFVLLDEACTFGRSLYFCTKPLVVFDEVFVFNYILCTKVQNNGRKTKRKNNIDKYESHHQRHLWGKNVVVSSEGYV